MRRALALLAFGLIASAWAEEESDYTAVALYRAPESPPPSAGAARALVEAFLAQVRAPSVDPAWLEASVRPMDLPVAPDPAWYARFGARLGPTTALGAHLRVTPGVVATAEGPDYVRVLLGGEPRIGVVVRAGPDGAPVIDRLEATTCDLCTEPVRFVRDLVDEVTRRRSAAGRLVPGVEIDVSGWLAANSGVVPHHWLAALEARNHGAGHLAWLLGGAQVTGAEGPVVLVDLADGSSDRWTVVWRHGRFAVDYAALPDDSPLRMSPTEAAAWRSDSSLEEGALQGWTPPWTPTPDEAGWLVGERAVGAAFDPRDGTLLLGVLDLDRKLAGVFRVDPEQRRVVERLPIDAPSPTTPIAWRTWFTRWTLALGPRGRHLAMTSPGRVWTLDLRSGEAEVAWRADDVSALAWSRNEATSTLLVGTSDGDVAVFSDAETRWADVGAEPLLLDLDGDTLIAVTRDGRVVAAPDDAPSYEVRACPGDATSAARAPDGAEILVTCADGDALGAFVPWPPGTPRGLAGAPSRKGGASYSPDGAWFTTGAAGEGDPLLLWDVRAETPIARLGVDPVRAVAWSPDGASLATVEEDGRVWLWDLATVRRTRGL